MDFKEILESRRAVNHFDPSRDVPADLLRRMVEMAANSPSSFNLQPWSLIVLREPRDKARLRALAMDQPKVTEAPAVLIVLGDRHGWRPDHPFAQKVLRQFIERGIMQLAQADYFTSTCKKLYGQDPDYELAFACKNAGFFAMSLMYAASELGLDTHPMDGFDHEAVRREFNIPDQYWIPLLLAVGHHDATKPLLPAKWRKSYEEIVVSFE